MIGRGPAGISWRGTRGSIVVDRDDFERFRANPSRKPAFLGTRATIGGAGAPHRLVSACWPLA